MPAWCPGWHGVQGASLKGLDFWAQSFFGCFLVVWIPRQVQMYLSGLRSAHSLPPRFEFGFCFSKFKTKWLILEKMPFLEKLKNWPFSLEFWETKTKIQTRVSKNVQISAQINTSKLGAKFEWPKSTPKMTELKNQDLSRTSKVWDII